MKRSAWSVLSLVIVMAGSAAAQTSTPQVARGTAPLGSFGGGPDIINLGNLNAHYTIPVLSRAGRGNPFGFNLGYDTSIWYPSTSSGTTSWTPVTNWGWTGTADLATPATGALTSEVFEPHCSGSNYNFVYIWTYTDKSGVRHLFPGLTQASGPCGNATSLNKLAPDGSGYYLQATGGSGTVTWRSGTLLGGPGSLTDNNGNKITVSGSSVYDTLSSTKAMVTASGSPSAPPVKYSYTNSQGTTSYVTVNYTNHTVQTAFGCSNIAEYQQSNIPLVSTISLADGSKYTFTYEPTPGHSANVTADCRRSHFRPVVASPTITLAETTGSSALTEVHPVSLGRCLREVSGPTLAPRSLGHTGRRR